MSDAPDTLPRLGLVGASSLLGKEIKDKLAASGFPGEALTLFDLEDVAGVLTEYGDEARVLAETIAEDLLEHELVCFGGDAASAAEHLDAVLASDRLAIDCTGAWHGRDNVFPWVPGISESPRVEDHRALSIPSAAVIAASTLCQALGDLTATASLTVMSPASELGDAGIQELSQQSTAVLNLLELDEDAFGRQQAFDLWIPDDEDTRAANALSAALQALGVPTPAVNVVATPIFHGMALSAFVAGTEPATVQAQLESGGIAGADEGADSPRLVVGTDGLKLLSVRGDAGGTWAWAAADNLTLRAGAAVAAMHTLLGSPLSDALQ